MRLLNLLGVGGGTPRRTCWDRRTPTIRAVGWEPQWVIELNDELLARLGTVWQQPFPLEPGWERRPSSTICASMPGAS